MISLPYQPTVILFFLNLLWLRANASGNYTDHLSLLKFKEAITRDPNEILNSWNDSIPFCNWFGIRCSSRHQRVTSMVLAEQNLVGSISPYIGNLSFLRVINLQGNSLNGGIPHEVGQLFRLQRFNLTNNKIGGQIPVSIVNCSQLRQLIFYGNKIVGTIPAEIGSLENLQNLALQQNYLTGKIPPSISNISALRSLRVGYNKLEGSIPEDLGRLSNLNFLVLGPNTLSGVISPSVFNITSLVLISAVENQLHGTLPDNICLSLPNLQYFGLGINAFSGAIPKFISNCSQLKVFDIKANNFVGQVPIDIGKLQSLYWLGLGSNNLGSSSTEDLGFLASLTNCSNLQILAFAINRFGGTLPKSIANLSTQLNYFYLGGNQISGTVPAGLDNLVNLIGLALEWNHFIGSIPSYLGKLQQLQLLALEQNRFSGKIPSSLGNLTQLNKLSLFDNKLEGSIPSSIGNCQMLSYLELSMNNLSGEIPPQILFLSSLSKTLSLAQNILVGKLPPEVGKLTNLNMLDLSENNMSGKIPETIGQCENLEYLDLEGNSFEGTIPSSLVSLRGLRSLDLSRNNLSGQIRKDLQNLPFLENLNLSFNYLEGEVPIRGVFKNTSAISLYGNSKLCGGVSELRLRKCPYQKGKSSHSKLAIIVICLVVPILLLLAFGYLYCKRSSKKKSPPTVLIGEHLIKVSYGDLYRATSGFSPDKLIGCGGFSSVYRGSLVQVEKTVAVKVLNLDKKGATKSFKVECRALRNIRHRNIVKVLTYCSSIDYKGNEFKALVYEFMENGSLEKWLHPTFAGGDDSCKLSILQRLNVAIDVASALHYLHDLCEIPTVHCDLKPSNILLDDDMVAHLSDFGLARLFSTDNDHPESQSSTIGNKGTIGYAAPEYGTAAAASKEGDVYSYGILLLEMFSGRRPTEEMFNEELNLHGFVKAALPTKLLQIIDPSLLPRDAIAAESDDDNAILEEEDMNYENDGQTTQNMLCVLSVLEIGLACSVESPKDRMKVVDVTRKLHLIRTDFEGSSHHNGRPGTNLQNH